MKIFTNINVLVNKGITREEVEQGLDNLKRRQLWDRRANCRDDLQRGPS